MEEEMEMIHHWIHHHPLSLVKRRATSDDEEVCYGCGEVISIEGEAAYGCSKKCADSRILFHQECAEMPRKIRHPMHPHHTLIQQRTDHGNIVGCAICDEPIRLSMSYKCTSPECQFEIHMVCAQDKGVMDDEAVIYDIIEHVSHPQHPLERVSRMCSARCDACGSSSTHKGIFYACFLCHYWIHKRCALLPRSIQITHHHHSLSLSFSTPKHSFTCQICRQYLRVPKYWIYFCQYCMYLVHIKCAMANLNHFTLPINDIVAEQIEPFVQKGGHWTSLVINNVKSKFPYEWHNHELSLISSSAAAEEKDSDDDDEVSELICDGCITPIFKRKHTSDKYEYMGCSKCRYFLHMACFKLPPELPYFPLHPKYGHSLILKSCGKLEFWKTCSVCRIYTNGLFYTCTKCDFIVDIKCASLLDPVYHLAHPRHLLNHLSATDMVEKSDNLGFSEIVKADDNRYFKRECFSGCGETSAKSDCYVCGSCDFVVHVRCATLPASITDRRWDDHPLLLSYDAGINHPSDFYCDQCEGEINPKSWMYHCRQCDSSFHPDCFPTTSGEYRNIKFGQQYNIGSAHPHPLTYHFLDIKRRCDACNLDKHGERGFECASCYFFICLNQCGEKMLQQGRVQIAD